LEFRRRSGRQQFVAAQLCSGLQFYGIGRIDGETQLLTVSLHDVEGKQLYKIDLVPQV